MPCNALFQPARVQFEQMTVEVVEIQRQPVTLDAAARRADLCPTPLSMDSVLNGLFESPACYYRLPNDTEPAMVITAITRDGACQPQMENPVWVVTGEAAVSRDHNYIFNDPLAAALAAHVDRAIVSAQKRLALRASLQLD